MITPTELMGCFALDLLFGDPEWLPHPVRIIGRAIEGLERSSRPFAHSSEAELAAGAAITATVTLGVFTAARLVLRVAARKGRDLRMLSEILCGWTALALRNLTDEAQAVIQALENGKIALARRRLARIVGRDTQELNESEIARAVIETLAESTCDGVIAPMFYLVIGGAPLALAFKAVSTLDSMIGHRDARYLHFGRAAARADDVMNYIPARLSAAAIATAALFLPGADSHSALTVWKRDANKHLSPNAGRPEAAMAGALRVRLGGVNTYDGEAHQMPYFGAEFEPPSIHEARQALKLAFGASLIALAAALAVSVWRNGEN